jgi:tRNA nucleotidyltransferase/poly(A) polymerase
VANTGSPRQLVALTHAVEVALHVSRERNERVFLVGGVVRDILMGRAVGEHDLDLVVEGAGLRFAAQLADRLQCSIRQHEPFLTAKLMAPFGVGGAMVESGLDEVDVATAREEVYERPGALPTVTAASIETDLWRRDFSANAIALPLSLYRDIHAASIPVTDVVRQVIDPTGGCTDINNSTLRILHPKSFIDDPTRLFRAVRYVVRLGFHFDMATLAGFLEAVKSGALTTLSPRRVWNEVMTAFGEAAPCEVLQEFLQRGLFSTLPVISRDDSAWIFEALERLEQLRRSVGQPIFFEAGKVLLVAGLLREGREDVVHAVHEGNRILKRAGAVLEADKAPEGLKTIPDAAAAYSIHCTRELQELLKRCVQAT